MVVVPNDFITGAMARVQRATPTVLEEPPSGDAVVSGYPSDRPKRPDAPRSRSERLLAPPDGSSDPLRAEIQLERRRDLAQLPQCVGLELPHALPRDPKLDADLLERPPRRAVEPEAEHEDALEPGLELG